MIALLRTAAPTGLGTLEVGALWALPLPARIVTREPILLQLGADRWAQRV